MDNSPIQAISALLPRLAQALESSVAKAQKMGLVTAQSTETSVYLASSKGNFREENQDRVLFAVIENQLFTNTNLAVVILSDGMGGMREGAKAASLALSSFLSYLACGREPGLKSLAARAISCSNDKVYRDLDGKGGATLSSILYGNMGCVGINVGDSRIYYLDKSRELEQLTTDDTIEGQLRQESESATCWLNAVEGDRRLVQYVGMGDGLEPAILDLSPYFQRDPESNFLLTSDGAHFLGNPMLKKIAKVSTVLEQIPSRIVTSSEWLGGHDNSSAILSPTRIPLMTGQSADQNLTIKVSSIGIEFQIICPRVSTPQQTHLAKVVSDQDKAGDIPREHASDPPSIHETEKEVSIPKVETPSVEGKPKKKSRSGKRKKEQRNKSTLKLDFISVQTGPKDETTD